MTINVLAANFTAPSGRKDGGACKHAWEKPPDGLVKLNIDAPLNEETGCGATGVTLRDVNGLFMPAANQFLAHVQDMEMAEPRPAEATALLHGLEFALQVGCNRLLVNSGNIAVIQLMNEGRRTHSAAAAVIASCTQLVKEFAIVTFSHCPREANDVADSLARHSNSLNSKGHEPPFFIVPQLVRDMTIIEQ